MYRAQYGNAIIVSWSGVHKSRTGSDRIGLTENEDRIGPDRTGLTKPGSDCVRVTKPGPDPKKIGSPKISAKIVT